MPLVLHGTSGLGEGLIRRSIELGICTFNGNTEGRTAYMNALWQGLSFDRIEVLDLMVRAIDAMKGMVLARLSLSGSVDEVA
jgi:tagatose 1,6-diphosphate aldolase GatY/KbaY